MQTSNKTRLQGLIFDVDGTLADTEELHRRAFNQAFAETGLDWHWNKSTYIRLLSISGGLERIHHWLDSNPVPNAPKPLDRDNFIRSLHSLKSERYRELLAHNRIRLRPGIERLIDEALDNGIRLGIVTNSCLSNLETLFDLTLGRSVLAHFNTIITCDLGLEKKPSPTPYQHALSAMNATAAQTIAIEDSANGHHAARSAGLKTVVTTHAMSRDAHYDGAVLVTDMLGEPHTPFRVLAGNNHGWDHVDLALLNHLVCMSAGTETTQTPPSQNIDVCLAG